MRLLVAGGVLATAVSGSAGAAEPADGCRAMVGAWEYVKPSAPGYVIIAEQGDKYLGIFVNTLAAGDAAREGLATAANPKQSGPASFAGAWEYACEGSRGKARLSLRWLYSSYRPRDVGSGATLEVEVDGDQARWWWLGADGKRGTMGAGRRMK